VKDLKILGSGFSLSVTFFNGWFTLVRYRRRFCIKPAGLVMKKIFFFKQNVQA